MVDQSLTIIRCDVPHRFGFLLSDPLAAKTKTLNSPQLRTFAEIARVSSVGLQYRKTNHDEQVPDRLIAEVESSGYVVADIHMRGLMRATIPYILGSKQQDNTFFRLASLSRSYSLVHVGRCSSFQLVVRKFIHWSQ